MGAIETTTAKGIFTKDLGGKASTVDVTNNVIAGINDR
jgi:isocitrate/isopropylmalate dehydrogenase